MDTKNFGLIFNCGFSHFLKSGSDTYKSSKFLKDLLFWEADEYEFVKIESTKLFLL